MHPEQKRDQRELLAEMRGRDLRPLLIVRTPTDAKVQKKLQAVLDNERVRLASHWFRCVRLDSKVADRRGPYAALFGTPRPPHLILASSDGNSVVRMLASAGDQVPWGKIVDALRRDYRKSADRAVKDLQRLLSRYDHLDARESEVRSQLAAARKGKRESQIAKLERELAVLERDRGEATAEEKRLRDLRARAPAKRG